MAAPAPLAEVVDLADWLGEPISDPGDAKRAEWALRMSSALVRAEASRTWLDENGQLDNPPEQAVLVTLASAGRAYTNPDDSVVSESIDDYNYREAEQQEAGAYLTASEKALLGKLAETYQGGIGTVSVERGDLAPWPCDEDERLLPPYY